MTTGTADDVFAIGLVLAGLCLAIPALSAREKQAADGGPSGRVRHLADGLLVLVAGVGGFFAAEGDEIAWLGVARKRLNA